MGFNLGSAFPTAAKIRRIRLGFRDEIMVRKSYVTMPSMVGLGLARKSSSCLSVTLLNDKDCERRFAIKAFEYGNAFDTIG